MKGMTLLLCMLGLQGALADSALVDFERGMIYPQQLGGMVCSQVEKYENNELGYSVFYEKGDTFSAEVSVYNLGREAIPSGYKDGQVGVVFKQVEEQQQRDQKSELISGVRKRGATVVPKKGDIRFANRVYQYAELQETDAATNSVPRIQSVYVTAAHNQFFSVQFRFNFADGKEAKVMSEQLIAQLVKMIRGGVSDQVLLLAGCDALINDPSSYAGRTAAQAVWKKAQTMGELNVYTHLFPWPTSSWKKPKNADLLMTAYLAGMLKVVLPQELESGGEAEGFEGMLQAYENMRTREEIEVIPQLDEWAKVVDKKALFEELLYETVEE